MQSNDLNILKKLKLGHPLAYKELFDTYYKPLCIHSLKYSDSFELSEDIVQNIFIKFWDEKLYEKLNGSIGPYLYTSVKNNTLKALKKESKYRFEEIENVINKLMTDESFDMVHVEEEKKKLHTAIESLPIKCREVFKAIVLENQKYKDVALQIGISVNTVKTHHSRALKQLRNSLGAIIIFLSS